MAIILAGCQKAPAQQNNQSEPEHTKANDSEEPVPSLKTEAEEPMTTQEKEQFFQAVEIGNISEITSFIEDGADINSVDQEGRTAAMLATYNNDPETVKLLINNGADVNIQDNMKNNPFLYAGAEGYLEIVKLTINAGADPKLLNRFGGTALIPASEHGYVYVVKELLEQTDIDVNHVNDLGWTAILEAVVLGNGGKHQQDTLQLLITHGADVNIPDSNGVTPLQHAKKLGYKKISDILLDAGAN
ncbi:ankyrin repeat domain-containing protein [Niallia circulans]|uniref:Ankyrin repeat domain-containing protein n=1 Tax=Niallia circulans TaxID=1397 RepID=A0A553SPV4_NIACI|nr:ankyrin repeat domain-containing protein [Niallia circulans]